MPQSKGKERELIHPEAVSRRKKRLEQLLSLALAYRDCTRKELARTLGRDPTKLVPGTGIPKLDVVVELAGVLEWPVGDVVDYLWNHKVSEVSTEGRAAESLRDAVRWRRLGRYIEVVDAATLGLGRSGLTAPSRRALQAILADAYYALWSLVESRSLARDLVETYQANPPKTLRDLATQASAHYLCGQTHRRLMSVERQQIEVLADAARVDLENALVLYRRLARQTGEPSHDGLANACVGALIEVDVAQERCPPGKALSRLLGGLEHTCEPGGLTDDALASYGWWCLYGCNIALRHLDDERVLQQHMAVFTNKADEIANRLDDWPMRERVFTMQHTRWERATGSTCFEIPRVIDSDDVRIITGTMGRFPTFRPTGWRILQTAQIIG